MIDNSTVLFEDSPLTALPGTVVGYRENGMPIYNIAGGAADVVTGDDTDDDDDDVDDSDDNGTDSDDAWTPPSKEEWEKTLAAKAKADSESAARKRFLRAAGYDPKTGEKVNKPSIQLEGVEDTDVTPKKDEPAVDKKADTGFDREKFEKQFQRQLDREVSKAERTGRASAYPLIHEVPNALEEAGWNGKNLPRMIKLLDLDSLSIDDSGIDPDELNEQVAELKRDFPEFFKRARMKDAAKEVADTKAVGGGKKQAPASEEDLDWKAKMKLQLMRPSN
jgi:hypothetical protein